MNGKYLVVVDYQNDFVDGALGFAGAENLDSGIVNLIQKYGKNTIYTLDTHYDNYLQTQEGRKLPVKHCLYESNGWLSYGKTAKALTDAGALQINKSIFGVETSVWQAKLLEVFKDATPSEFIIVGLVTDICVLSNAVTLRTAFPEAQITVVEDLVSSFNLDNHINALKIMQNSLQVELIKAKDIK